MFPLSPLGVHWIQFHPQDSLLDEPCKPTYGIMTDGTIKIPLCSKAVRAEKRPKFCCPSPAMVMSLFWVKYSWTEYNHMQYTINQPSIVGDSQNMVLAKMAFGRQLTQVRSCKRRGLMAQTFHCCLPGSSHEQANLKNYINQALFNTCTYI